jgi:hypothetical protein
MGILLLKLKQWLLLTLAILTAGWATKQAQD